MTLHNILRRATNVKAPKILVMIGQATIDVEENDLAIILAAAAGQVGSVTGLAIRPLPLYMNTSIQYLLYKSYELCY